MKTPAKPEGQQQQIQQQTMAEDSVVCVALGLEKLENITSLRKATIREMGEVCQYLISELFLLSQICRAAGWGVFFCGGHFPCIRCRKLPIVLEGETVLAREEVLGVGRMVLKE